MHNGRQTMCALNVSMNIIIKLLVKSNKKIVSGIQISFYKIAWREEIVL